MVIVAPYDFWLDAHDTGPAISNILAPYTIAANTDFVISVDVSGCCFVEPVEYSVNGLSRTMETGDNITVTADIVGGVPTAGVYDLCITAEN